MIAKIKLLVLPSWYIPDGGYFFREHAQALAEEGCDVDVLVNRLTGLSTLRRKDLPYLRRFSIERQDKITEIRSYMIKLPLADRLSIRLWIKNTCKHFDRYYRRFGEPDLILAHSSIWAGVVAQRINEKYNIPYIITEHRSRFIQNTEEARKLVRRADLPLIHRALTGCKKLVTVSSGLKEGMLSLFPELGEKTMCIPNMVDTEFFRPADREHGNDEFVFLYAGILEKVKGLDVLLTAFKKLLAGRYIGEKKVVLRIAGRGSQLESLERQASVLGISGNISFHGYLSRQELFKEYQQADAFILPSRFEAFGVVLIEAMSCGLPVIATRSGGPSTIVPEGCGILTKIEDEDALSEAMSLVMDHHSGYDPGMIRNYVQENYSKELIARKYMQLMIPICHDQD